MISLDTAPPKSSKHCSPSCQHSGQDLQYLVQPCQPTSAPPPSESRPCYEDDQQVCKCTQHIRRTRNNQVAHAYSFSNTYAYTYTVMTITTATATATTTTATTTATTATFSRTKVAILATLVMPSTVTMGTSIPRSSPELLV